jgi:hypothetical protein
MLDNASAVATVASSFGVWAGVPTATLSFADAGSLPVDVTAANYTAYVGHCGDGLSPIVFDADGSIIDDVFGVGASDTVLGFAAPECATYVPPVISEGLAVLNGKFIDGIDTPTNPEISLAEFDAVFIHEFGHYLDLDHSQVGREEAFDGDPSDDGAIPTMFPILENAAAQSSPSLDDAVALSTLYPAPSFGASFGSITGRVLRSDGAPFQGAYVIARKIDDPRITAVGVASGDRWFPANPGGPGDPDLVGRYEIDGLPPGSYTVEVEAIDPVFTGGSSVGPLDPPTALPGPPELWNGIDEAGTNPPDDPAASTPLVIAAGATASGIDVVLNALACPPTPLAGCKRPVLARGSALQIRGDKPALSWKWGAGAATTLAELGDPVTATGYDLCVYDESGGTPALVLEATAPAGGTCAGRACWRASRAGFGYANRDLTPSGVAKLSLRPGDEGRARIQLKAKGALLAVPPLPLADDGAVVVQLDNTAGACWEATYSAPALASDAFRFKDVSD